MESIWMALFIINISLLLVHEMDAVRNREWRMFIVLKDMEDEKACRIFVLAHVPLYVAALFLLMSPAKLIVFYVLDVLLILHAVIHFGFRHHKHNAFTSTISKAIIYMMAAISAVHLTGICLLT